MHLDQSQRTIRLRTLGFLAILIFLCGLPNNGECQHSQMYNQYMFNGFALNPAYAGSRDVLSISAHYRHQWAGFKGAPRTQTVFAHSPLKNPKNNVGVALINDQLGVTRRTSLTGTYAYRLELTSALRLSFGLQGGLSMIQDRWADIITDETGDQAFSANSPVFVVPKVGFGLYLDHRKFYLGASIPHLLDYKNSDYSLYIQESNLYKPWFFTGGLMLTLNPYLKLRPSVLVKYLQNSPVQVDLNANLVVKDKLWFGASYRSNDAVVGLMEFQINPQFRLGYSYDYPLTELSQFTSGSHEIMIRYEFGYSVKALSPRYF